VLNITGEPWSRLGLCGRVRSVGRSYLVYTFRVVHKEFAVAKYSEQVSCKCGQAISVDTVHHAGGVNDKDTVTLKCSKCGALHEARIENVESAHISGATKQ